VRLTVLQQQGLLMPLSLCSAGILQQADPDALSSLHDAVVQLAVRPLDGDEGEQQIQRDPAD
jgi:hypothetical protein